MSRILGLIVLIGLFALQDVVILSNLAGTSGQYSEIVHASYWVLFVAIAYFSLGYAILSYGYQKHPRSPFFNLMTGSAFSFLSTKFVLFLIMLIIGICGAFVGLLGSSYGLPSIVYLVAYIVAGAISCAMLYGVIFGKYKYQIEEVSVYSDKVDGGLNGLRIVQISDIHAGTWDSVAKVKRGIDLINAQQADLILFTGDLVNRHKDEIDPYIDAFASLTAPYGKYAVLGNHDYVGFPRAADLRQHYWADLKSKFDSMGFSLLLNEHVLINTDSDSFALVGVENWGDGRFFPKRGDLDKAVDGLDKELFTVLMTHDPSHWRYRVLGHDRFIDLTLSGHTHGMQFGIKLGSFQWSPVKFRYPHWMGLYIEGGKQLYVNRGFGLLAFPGRVGMYPEITVITLKSNIIDN